MLQPVDFAYACMKRYGNAFTLRLFGFEPGRVATIVVVTDPDMVRQVFAADPETFCTGAGRNAMQPIFGAGSTLLLDGDEHLRHRRLVLPPFHGPRLDRYRELIAEIAGAEVGRWPVGRRFRLRPAMQRITLTAIVTILFGGDAPARREQIQAEVRRVLDAVSRPLNELAATLPLPRNVGAVNIPGFTRLLRRMDSILFDQIRIRRADPAIERREDLLSMLIQARDEEGRALTDAELRDELVTLLIAGHESTSTALSWTFEHLLRHPAVLDRLVRECEGEKNEEYLDAVIKESLRLNPPFPAVDRKLARPLALNGYVLPADTVVAPATFIVHRRPELFPEPEAFRPERFLASEPAPNTWFPYGGAPRRCLGASYSSLQMHVVIKTILRSARLAPASSRPAPIRRRNIVLAPGDDVPVVLTARATPAR